jgi:hypothetical protein
MNVLVYYALLDARSTYTLTSDDYVLINWPRTLLWVFNAAVL